VLLRWVVVMVSLLLPLLPLGRSCYHSPVLHQSPPIVAVSSASVSYSYVVIAVAAVVDSIALHPHCLNRDNTHSSIRWSENHSHSHFPNYYYRNRVWDRVRVGHGNRDNRCWRFVVVGCCSCWNCGFGCYYHWSHSRHYSRN